jgi:FkbM family methyltransferase
MRRADLPRSAILTPLTMMSAKKVVFSACAFGVVLLGAAVYFYQPARLSALVLIGRGTVCPISQAWMSPANQCRQAEYKDQILKASRLAEKDPTGYNAWDTPSGRYWMPKGSDYALPWDLAEQQRRIYGTGQRSVQPGDIVLDCGANVGVYTRVALAAGAKQVIAIEIAPENLECLRRNFPEEIRQGRVVIYPKGVWDKDDFLTLSVDPQNSAADSVVMRSGTAQEGPRVPLTTIDKIVGELQLERVDYIKMDIEGAEQNALKGARSTLAKFHPRLALSAYHRPDDPEKLPQLVREGWSGYRMECGPCAGTPTQVRPEVINFY